MVQKILGFLYKEASTVHTAAYLLGFFAILSQILAFLRDRLLAHIFGASLELDIYYAAFRIPDFIFITAASIVSISVLVPFIIERESQGKEVVRKFIDNIFSFFSIFIVIACGVTYFLIPSVSAVLFKGFTPEALEKTVSISRLMLLSPVFLGLSNLLGSLTQAYNRFTVYALSPIVYNIGIILGIILYAEEMGAMGVAVGVVIGASLHALVQVPFVVRLGLLPRPSWRFDMGSIRRVIALSLPRTLSLSTSQIAIIFMVSLATLMAEGSVSVLSLSINLQSVPLAIIGVSYSLAAFPTLSRHFAEKNRQAFIEQMTTTARHIIFWSIPLTALFIVLRAQIVRVLLGTGQFSWDNTRLVAAALALFVVSSVFQSLLLLFMRGFYSAGYTKKPLILNVVSTVLIGVMAYVLVKVFYNFEWFGYFFGALLKVGDISDIVVLVLPLAYSIGTIINTLLHWSSFEREFRGFSRGVFRALFQSFGTAVIMGAVAYFGLYVFAPLIDTTSLVGIFLQGLLAGILAMLAGVGMFYALRSVELREVWDAVRMRFWKTKVIATDPEIV